MMKHQTVFEWLFTHKIGVQNKDKKKKEEYNIIKKYQCISW